IATYRYSDYGETERTGDSTFANEIAYTGGIYDEDTTLYYLNARYYSPHDARFMTVDPARDGANYYAYCGSDPINNIDPFGLEKIVMSGGRYDSAGTYGYEFIDTALKKLRA
ncbi:MAG: RHS repeat-associated core domain-containing protein, partial [Coriobacteriales bacterium]|nr:RHS repeat-associated core domain-containing protein [Coriobacteriales bacterium]